MLKAIPHYKMLDQKDTNKGNLNIPPEDLCRKQDGRYMWCT